MPWDRRYGDRRGAGSIERAQRRKEVRCRLDKVARRAEIDEGSRRALPRNAAERQNGFVRPPLVGVEPQPARGA